MSTAAATQPRATRKRAELAAVAPTRAIVYCRISSDPREKRAGVDRQEHAARELAAQLGWNVVDVIVDNDRSNSIARKREREGFTRLLDAMENGTTGADAVIFFDQDRFVKDPAEWGRWMSLQLAGRGLRVAIVGQGEIATDSADGFMMSAFRMMSSTTDTMRQVKRIRAFTEQQRERGKPNGRVMYGWRRVIVNDAQGYRVDWYDEVHPEQSAVLRECAQRVLAGESISSIARDLDARGVPCPSEGRKHEAKRWENSTITRMLKRPANAGLRVADGAETTIANPAILTRAEWKRVELVLSDPKRRTITDNRVRHLLTGIAVCGKCAANGERNTMRRLTINAKRPDGYVWNGYTCKRYQHLGAKQSDVDSIVEDVVLGWLSAIDPRELLDTDDAEEARMREAAEQLDVLQAELDSYIADAKRKLGDPLRVSKSELDEQRSALVPQIEAARHRATPTSVDQSSPVWALANAADPRKLWGKLALEQQRAVIAGYWDVQLNPATPGHPRNRFEAGRVVPTRKPKS